MTALCMDALRAKIEEQLQAWEVPGIFVGAWQDGKTLLCEGFGRKDEEGGVCDGRTLFQIGSCTKAFTAAAALILKERGLLDLDKPVKDYLPDFDLMDPYAARHVTVRDLLCHRSGLPRHEYAWYRTDFTREQLVHNLRCHAPNMGLRQGYQYNNLGFVLVGWLIEKLTGKNVGSTLTAGNHSSTCTVYTGIRSLCTTQTKFHNAITFCSLNDAGCFSSNQTLMIKDSKDSCLN